VPILVPETGAGLPTANSYVTLEYADLYFESHPYNADAWANITDEDRREALLIAATTFIDTYFDWKGYRLSESQGLDWPRVYVYDGEGVLNASSVIPEKLKRAVCEQAFMMSKGDPSLPPTGAGLTSLRLDVIQLDFDKGARPALVNAYVVGLLRDLGEYTFARRIRKVIVG
jgi:hypothetical protein